MDGCVIRVPRAPGMQRGKETSGAFQEPLVVPTRERRKKGFNCQKRGREEWKRHGISCIHGKPNSYFSLCHRRMSPLLIKTKEESYHHRKPGSRIQQLPLLSTNTLPHHQSQARVDDGKCTALCCWQDKCFTLLPLLDISVMVSNGFFLSKCDDWQKM